MSTFKRYLLKHEYIVNIFFSTYPYARPSVKSQQIGYIGYVDKKSLWEIPSKDWYLHTLLMWSGITFISFKKVTILKIYPKEEIYFFASIFENWRICPMFEYSVSKQRIIDIFSLEMEIRLALIKEEKKVIWIVTQKCFLKNFQKQQCCIFDGWRWKKVAVKVPKNKILLTMIVWIILF